MSVGGGQCEATFGVLCVGDCIPDYVLEEHLEDTSCLLVDETDNFTENFAVTLGASFPESLASLTASSQETPPGVSPPPSVLQLYMGALLFPL